MDNIKEQIRKKVLASKAPVVPVVKQVKKPVEAVPEEDVNLEEENALEEAPEEEAEEAATEEDLNELIKAVPKEEEEAPEEEELEAPKPAVAMRQAVKPKTVMVKEPVKEVKEAKEEITEEQKLTVDIMRLQDNGIFRYNLLGRLEGLELQLEALNANMVKLFGLFNSK